MQTRLWISVLLTFFSALARAVESERTVDIFAWPLSAPKPLSFVRVSYTSTNASIKSYSAPQISPNDDIVRVGFNRPSGDWSGVATAASNLAEHKSKRLQLHVKADGELYHVGFKVADGVSQGASTSTKDGVSVEVLRIAAGPGPYLNKPVVVSADGKAEEKEPEKTFFQKYWWAIALFILMQMVAGGGQQKES